MMFHSHSFLTSQPLNTYQWPPSHPKWTQISPQLLASGSPDLWSQRGTGKRRLLGDQGSWRHWYMGYSDTHPPPPDSAGLWSLWHSRSVRDPCESRLLVSTLPPVFESQFTLETLAMEGSRLVLALPIIGAGRASALVDVLLTPGACESWWGREWVRTGGEGHLFFSLDFLGSLLQIFELYRHNLLDLNKNLRV